MLVLALIVFLRRPAGDQLHALGIPLREACFRSRWCRQNPHVDTSLTRAFFFLRGDVPRQKLVL
jgi:hypothetical protein